MGLVLLPCDSIPWQWAGVTSPASHRRSVKSKKNTLQVSLRGSCFLLWPCLCPGLGVKFHIHLLLPFCDCVAGCWMKYCSFCWPFYCCFFSRQGTRFGGRGGWFCFIFASFWAVSLWSFLIIWISCSSFIKFFLTLKKELFLHFTLSCRIGLMQRRALALCLMSSSLYLQFSSWFIIWKQISSAEHTLWSEGICCRASLQSRKCIYVLILFM